MNPSFCNYFFPRFAWLDLYGKWRRGTTQPNPTHTRDDIFWQRSFALTLKSRPREAKKVFFPFSVEDPPSIINDVLLGQHTHTYVSIEKLKKNRKRSRKTAFFYLRFPHTSADCPFLFSNIILTPLVFPAKWKEGKEKFLKKIHLFPSFRLPLSLSFIYS